MAKFLLSSFFVAINISLGAVNSKEVAVTDFLQASNIRENMDFTIRQLVKAQVAKSPTLAKFESELLAFYIDVGSYPANEDFIKKLYSENFNEDELKELIKFHNSPVGRKSLMMVPRLSAEIQGEIERKTQKMLPQLKEKIEIKVKSEAKEAKEPTKA